MSDEPTFDAVLDAAAVLDELPDLARSDAWASSVLGIWAEDAEASAIDDHFVAWLRDSPDPRSARVFDAIQRVVDPVGGAVPPTRAWRVDQRGSQSLGIGFGADDGSEHSLLVDIVDGELTSLIVAPGPAELFDGSEDLIDPEPLEVGDAADAMMAAWTALVARRLPPPDDVWVNGALARARLRFLTDEDVTGFARPYTTVDTRTPDDDSERAELNAWALAVLDGGRVGAGVAGDECLLDALIPARTASYPEAEREAFAALEWADWLGVVLGLHRASPPVIVEPGMLIDAINRCPEVTSDIPKKDRPYFEWALSMVIPLWRDAGVIDDNNTLSDDGSAMLVHALRQAWS